MTVNCPPKYGSGNTFVNKLQSKNCMHCKEIHDAALEREKQTGVPQHYDIFVAYSLCSYEDLKDPEKPLQPALPSNPNPTSRSQDDKQTDEPVEGARSKAPNSANGTAISLVIIVVGFIIQAVVFKTHATADLKECTAAEVA